MHLVVIKVCQLSSFGKLTPLPTQLTILGRRELLILLTRFYYVCFIFYYYLFCGGYAFLGSDLQEASLVGHHFCYGANRSCSHHSE